MSERMLRDKTCRLYVLCFGAYAAHKHAVERLGIGGIRAYGLVQREGPEGASFILIHARDQGLAVSVLSAQTTSEERTTFAIFPSMSRCVLFTNAVTLSATVPHSLALLSTEPVVPSMTF